MSFHSIFIDKEGSLKCVQEEYVIKCVQEEYVNHKEAIERWLHYLSHPFTLLTV